jgi:tetratricopeptide (TPR) repeat protein
VALDLLSEDDAWRLLSRRLGAARVTAEPGAVRDIIDACARLPLTLTLVAARAATHPGFALSVLADQLRDALTGLDAFDNGDATSDVRALFSWSYRTLSPDAARMFRLLGLHPGPDLATSTAASLAAVPVRRARLLLAELTRAHLVTELVPDRFTFHDLLRAYAAEQTAALDSDTDRRTAVHRMLDHYLHTGYAASLRLDPYRYPVPPAPALPGITATVVRRASDALAWYKSEHTALLAAIRRAALLGFDTHAWQLACTLPTYLDRQGHWNEFADNMRLAHETTTRLGEPEARAITHRCVARAYARLGRHAEARTHLLAARELFGDAQDRAGLAGTYLALAELREREDDYRLALDDARQALELYRSSGNQQGQARALNAAGWYHAHVGDHDEALRHCQQAVALHEAVDDRSGAAGTFDSLGYIHHRLGDHETAVEFYGRAIELRRSLSDRYNEARTLDRLGDTHLAAGDLVAAADAWYAAFTILDQLGHHTAEDVMTKVHALDRPDAAGTDT